MRQALWLSLDTRGMTLGDLDMEQHLGMLMSVGSLFWDVNSSHFPSHWNKGITV